MANTILGIMASVLLLIIYVIIVQVYVVVVIYMFRAIKHGFQVIIKLLQGGNLSNE